MQNRQFEGGTGDDGANCSESLMGDGERHGGIKPFPAVRDKPKVREKKAPDDWARGVGRFFVFRTFEA